MPRVTVIIPVFNAALFVEEAVRSVLSQTYRDFQVVTFDDGSTDGTVRILERLAADDPRIKLVSRENRGYTRTLNEAISASSGEFIARMDADDISMPERLRRQVEFLHENKSHAVVGSHIEMIDPEGIPIHRMEYPSEHEEIDGGHIRGGCVLLAHPSVMMRAEAIRDVGGYRVEMEPAEDYDLWLRMGERWRLANVPECLVRYRLHATSQSRTRQTEQWEKGQLARSEAIARRGMDHVSSYPPPSTVKHLRCHWARLAHNAGEYGNARLLAIKALRYAPLSSQSWRIFGVTLFGGLSRRICRTVRRARVSE